MPDHCTNTKAGPCSSCDRIGTCITPQACHQPEPAASRRAKTFLPTFGLAGPYRRKRVRPPVPLWAWVLLWLACSAVFVGAFAIPLIHRFNP